MLSRKTLNTSPVKQNISPDSMPRSPRKQINTINQLLSLLKQHNISVPSQLLDLAKNRKTGCQFNLKLVESNKSKEIKKLKIQLGDVQFQLKKMEEDFAENKVMNRLEKERLTKKFVAEIQQLKDKIQEDNSSWEKRYTDMTQLLAVQKHNSQQRIFKQCQQKTQSNTLNLKTEYQCKIQQVQVHLKKLQKQLQSKQTLIQKQKQEIIEQYEAKNQNQIKQIKIFSVQKQKEITKKLQGKIQVIELQKRIESQKHEETLIQIQSQKEKLKTQIYYLQKDKEQLNVQIKAKQRRMMQLQITIRGKQHVLTSTSQQSERDKAKMQQDYQKTIKQINSSHAKESRQIMRQHLGQLDSYCRRIDNLQHLKMTIQSQYRDQMAIVQQKFIQRISKPQDVSEIQRLKTLTMLKNREIQKLKQQLKRSEMQRQNNQKNYNKIFSTNSSNSLRRKSFNSHRDRQAFFKQTTATNLKMILKACNQDF